LFPYGNQQVQLQISNDVVVYGHHSLSAKEGIWRCRLDIVTPQTREPLSLAPHSQNLAKLQLGLGIAISIH